MIFRQLFDYETYTYTYILADKDTKEAIIIDSVRENIERDLKLIKELGLNMIYSLETHIHADHITGASSISDATGAKKIAPIGAEIVCADMQIIDSDYIKFGSKVLKAIATPGHTNSCTSYLVEDMLFTGDALFIRGNGRTDFQNGSAEDLYDSIQKLYELPDETIVYPAHDYKGMTQTTIAEEKKYNLRISQTTTKEEFVQTMNALELANPKKIQEAVPANLLCGRSEELENAN